MKQPKLPPMVSRLKARLASNPKINLVDMGLPLANGLPTPRLKDVLEETVDDKYYLSNSTVEKIIRETTFQERLVSIKLEKPAK